MNVADPFYTGAAPGALLFMAGVAAVYFVGWLIERGRK